MPIDHRPNVSPRNATLITVVVVVAGLYFARTVLIPFALAILFSFLLAPLVVRLRRWHFARLPSVIAVVLFAFTVVATLGGLVSSQLNDFGKQLPEYQKNIHEKVKAFRESSSGVIGWISRVTHGVSEELNPPPPPSPSTPATEKPVPVEIRRTPFSPLQLIQAIIGSLLNVAITATLVVVFVFFMLLQREDLRDRFLRLFGPGRLNVTTRALDEAALRVSRYLLAQLVINVGFGLIVGVGLYFIGVPNPVLWGVLAALLRYVPYLGIWIAGLMPAAVAFAIGPDWMKPAFVIALYFGVDLLMYNFVEPLLYGSSTGLTPLAILFAAVIWTWLWGPVGLLLSTPLTVCAAVVGRYAPSLHFLGILLSDEPVLAPEKRFYQRLLGMDIEEATDVAEEVLKESKSLEHVFDHTIIPALSLAEVDRHAGELDDEHTQFILQSTRLIVEDLAERADSLIDEAGTGADNETPGHVPVRQKLEGPAEASVISIPARDDADEISALMLALLLNRHGIAAKVLSASALASERLIEAANGQIRVACISAVPPFGSLHVRYLCKRLRAQLPHVKVVAAVLSAENGSSIGKRDPRIPADEIATSLKQAVAEVVGLVSGTVEPVRQAAFSS